MKNNEKNIKNQKNINIENSVIPNKGMPETAEDMVNFYGTYEIQATAETDNQYPTIAQGYNKKIRTRDGENKHHSHNFEDKDT